MEWVANDFELIKVVFLAGLVLAFFAYYYYFFHSSRWASLVDSPFRVFSLWCSTGLLFGFFYALLDYFLKDKALKPNEVGYVLSFIDYVYFSFVSLATVGFGDIHPNSPLAKIAVVIESAMGICITILFAVSATNRANRLTLPFDEPEIFIERDDNRGHRSKGIGIRIILDGPENLPISSAQLIVFAHFQYASDEPVMQPIGIARLESGGSADRNLYFNFVPDVLVEKYPVFSLVDVTLQLSVAARMNTKTFSIPVVDKQKKVFKEPNHHSSQKYTKNMYKVI